MYLNSQLGMDGFHKPAGAEAPPPPALTVFAGGCFPSSQREGKSQCSGPGAACQVGGPWGAHELREGPRLSWSTRSASAPGGVPPADTWLDKL